VLDEPLLKLRVLDELLLKERLLLEELPKERLGVAVLRLGVLDELPPKWRVGVAGRLFVVDGVVTVPVGRLMVLEGLLVVFDGRLVVPVRRLLVVGRSLPMERSRLPPKLRFPLLLLYVRLSL